MNAKPDLNDPTTWPVADAMPTDVFLGLFTHDCTPDLTDEQKKWPVADAVPTDVFLGAFTETCTPAQTTEERKAEPANTSNTSPAAPVQRQAAPPARP